MWDRETPYALSTESTVGSIKVQQHKSNIPKVISFRAVSHKDPIHGVSEKPVFGELAPQTNHRGPSCDDRGAKRSASQHQKLLWLREGRRTQEAVIQRDYATVRIGHDAERQHNEAGRCRGGYIKIIAQPGQSPDLNINNRHTSASLDSSVYVESNGTFDCLKMGENVIYRG